jgi:hypothetical protein
MLRKSAAKVVVPFQIKRNSDADETALIMSLTPHVPVSPLGNMSINSPHKGMSSVTSAISITVGHNTELTVGNAGRPFSTIASKGEDDVAPKEWPSTGATSWAADLAIASTLKLVGRYPNPSNRFTIDDAAA